MTVPPYAVSVAAIALAAWASAAFSIRAPFIIGAAVVSIIGYILLIATPTAGSQYLGVHLAAAGVYTSNALLLSWPAENVSSQTKRAVALALQISIGDLGAIVGVLVYRPSLANNNYRVPHIIAIAYLVFGIMVTAWLWYWLSSENARREAIVSSSRDKDETSSNDDEAQRRVLGDRHVKWRYQL